MALKEKIFADLKEAMRNNEGVKRDTLRLLFNAIKNAEIEKKKKEEGLTDDEVMEVVSRAIKQRRDSVEQYRSGNRNDLAEKEEAEIAIFLSYLPKQMDSQEVEAIIKEIVNQMDESSRSNVGKIMQEAMRQLKGKADGRLVKEIAEKIIKESGK